MASPPPNKAPGLPNPYAKGILPNPYAATISAPPVKYTEEPQKKAPAFHNPHSIKRPQPKKPNPVVKRPTIPRAAMASLASASSSGPSDPSSAPEHAAIKAATTEAVITEAAVTEPAANPSANPQQHGIEYYLSTADDDAAILEERKLRNYEEKQRKKEQKKFTKQFGTWNPQAAYKAHRYSNLKAFRASGGSQRKKEGFRTFLKAAAAQYKTLHPDEPLGASRSTSPAASPAAPSTSAAVVANPLFAPPASHDDNPIVSSSDQTGEDAYARRMRLSQSQANSASSPSAREFTQEHAQEPVQKPAPPPPSVANHVTPPPPPPPPPPAASAPTSSGYQGATISAPAERYAHATISAPPERYAHATISAPPERYAHAIISAPPVRYDRPNVPTRATDDEPDLDERPSKRPKISKAEAMMAKMGYIKGQGLGKNNDGVVTHLEVKLRKGQQGASIFDDDEGNKIKSQPVWDVSGGIRKNDEPGKFGEESSVVVTWGCVDGVDWNANANRNDGGIRQDMGEAFGTKFGPIERIMLDEGSKDGAVYIHFQSVLAALNAVNRFDEGWEFRGRKIRAQYYDERKFRAGIYDY